MNNKNSTKVSERTESGIEKISRVSINSKIKKTHDRAAVFIEELKNQDQYNRTS